MLFFLCHPNRMTTTRQTKKQENYFSPSTGDLKLLSVQRVFIVLSTNHIGGAEKRFVGLWQFANQNRENVELYLVMTPHLKRHFENQKSFESGFKQYHKFIY